MSAEEFAVHFAGFDWPWYTPSVEEYSAVMDASGMDSGRVWGENADRYFPDAEEMIKWIDQPSLVPFLAQVPGLGKTASPGVCRRENDRENATGRREMLRDLPRINVSARKWNLGLRRAASLAPRARSSADHARRLSLGEAGARRANAVASRHTSG